MGHGAPKVGPQDHLVTLRDGRTLGYLDIGDPDGRPIVSCHGGLSSRLDVAPAAATATELGVRIISPDRPGVGLSDRQVGRTILDWSSDVAELADQLGFEQFAVMGWSYGGGFAQACAAALGERVTRLGLVASMVPPQWPGTKDEIDRMDRIFEDLSGRAAFIERPLLSLMGVAAHRLPRAFARSSGAPEASAAVITAAVAEGLEHTGGAVDDYRICNHPWGFEPADIAVPTWIWHGIADDLCPPAWGTRLAEAISGSTLTEVEGASHFLWYDHWSDILGTLAAP